MCAVNSHDPNLKHYNIKVSKRGAQIQESWLILTHRYCFSQVQSREAGRVNSCELAATGRCKKKAPAREPPTIQVELLYTREIKEEVLVKGLASITKVVRRHGTRHQRFPWGGEYVFTCTLYYSPTIDAPTHTPARARWISISAYDIRLRRGGAWSLAVVRRVRHATGKARPDAV